MSQFKLKSFWLVFPIACGPQSLINEANRIPSLTRGCRANDKMPFLQTIKSYIVF